MYKRDTIWRTIHDLRRLNVLHCKLTQFAAVAKINDGAWKPFYEMFCRKCVARSFCALAKTIREEQGVQTE